jgi:hypothetical protein
MNYTELFAAIEDYTENTFASGVVNTFIKQAEKRIYNTVQLAALRKNVTGTMAASNKYVQCPSDFLSVFSLAVIKPDGEYVYLQNKDVNFIREIYPTPTSTGVPKYYAIFGPSVQSSVISDELAFIFGPTPAAAYGMELHYYYYPESITTAPDGRTWLGDNYDPALLYGSLVEANIYIKGEQDMMAYYEKKFQDALAQLKRLGDGLERGDAYRDGQVKYMVT